MKNLKKVVVLMLIAAMMFTVFAGCSGGAKSEVTTSTTAAAGQTAATTTAAEDPLKDNMEISIALWGIGQAVDGTKNDAVRDQLYKDLNITIKPMNMTWEDYNNKVQVWALSGQLPDLFAADLVGKANLKKWITQGIIHDIPSDLSAYPQLQKLATMAGSEIFKYPIGDKNGKLYALPRLNHTSPDDWSTDCGVMVRKDWMQKVGVTKEPENMDEFTDLMVKFVNNDCNGNGKKDEIGLTMYSYCWLQWFFLGYEPGLMSGYWVKNPADPSKWIYASMTPKALEGIQALKKLYDAGGMDKDFASIKGDEGRDKFAASTAGAYSHDFTLATLAGIAEQFEKMPQNKGLKFADVVTFLKPFKNADGNYYRHIAIPSWSESYINAKCDDKKVDRILRLLNYVMEDKGYNLLHYGIEGTDWHKEGDTIVLTPQKGADGKEQSISTTYPICGAAFLMEWSGTHQWTCPTIHPDLQKASNDMNAWLQANAKPVPTNLSVGYLDVPSKSKATADFASDLVKMIMSKDVDKTFKEINDNYLVNGYTTYFEEVNAKCAELGITPPQ